MTKFLKSAIVRLKRQDGVWDKVIGTALIVVVLALIFKPWLDTFANSFTATVDTWWGTVKNIIFRTT